MKILVLNDGSEYQNWGIVACIDGLRQIFINNDCEFVSHHEMHRRYNFGPKWLGYEFFANENILFNKLFHSYNLLPRTANDLDSVVDAWQSGEGGKGAKIMVQKIINFKPDLIVFNAEGSTYKNNIGAIKGLSILYFVQKYHPEIKTAFINGSVTITSVDNTLGGIVRKVFLRNTFNFIREDYSYRNLLENYPLVNNCQIVLDSAFVNPMIENSQKVDTWLKKMNITSFAAFSLSMLPIGNTKMIASFLDKVFTNYDVVLLLARDVEDLSRIKFLQGHGKYKMIPSEWSYMDIEYLLQKCSLLMSGRYHHLIFGLKNQCSVIPVNTSSHKIKGLIYSLFGDSDVVDITDVERYTESEINEFVYNPFKLEGHQVEEIKDSIIKEYNKWL